MLNEAGKIVEAAGYLLDFHLTNMNIAKPASELSELKRIENQLSVQFAHARRLLVVRCNTTISGERAKVEFNDGLLDVLQSSVWMVLGPKLEAHLASAAQ